MDLEAYVSNIDLDSLLCCWWSWFRDCSVIVAGEYQVLQWCLKTTAHATPSLLSVLQQYKTFQWGDVVANFMGSGIGLFFSYHAERRYRTRREIERLYEPLDQELYGDETEEDDEREEETGGGVNVWKATNGSNGGGGEGKKVRFGENQILEEYEHEGQERGPTAGSNHKDNLFRIDDDDDD